MQFRLIGSSTSGHSYTPSNLDKINLQDKENLSYKTTLNPVIIYDKDGQLTFLETNWLYLVFYKGNEIFNYHSTNKYSISDKETNPETEQIKEVVTDTYTILKKNFSETIVALYPEMVFEDISQNTFEQIAQQLLVKFPQTQQ